VGNSGNFQTPRESPKYYFYVQNGAYVPVGYDPIDVSPNSFENAQVETCFYPPSNVTIEDLTPDPTNPKMVSVTYVVTVAATPMSTEIMNAYSAAGAPMPPPAPPPQEQRGVLRRLDATGWRLEQPQSP
jgi:hypothetical protein